MENEKERYLTEKEVSKITRRAVQTLRNDRMLGQNIPYVKIGRSVRYSYSEVINFMQSRKVATKAI